MLREDLRTVRGSARRDRSGLASVGTDPPLLVVTDQWPGGRTLRNALFVPMPSRIRFSPLGGPPPWTKTTKIATS